MSKKPTSQAPAKGKKPGKEDLAMTAVAQALAGIVNSGYLHPKAAQAFGNAIDQNYRVLCAMYGYKVPLASPPEPPPVPVVKPEPKDEPVASMEGTPNG